MLTSQNISIFQLFAIYLFQAVLELFLLDLKLPARFVELVHGSSTLAKLVKKVLDLLGKVLVLTLDGVKVLHELLVGRLDAEVFRAEVAALRLRRSDLVLEILGLQPPFVDDLVKVAASLLDDSGVGVVSLALSA